MQSKYSIIYTFLRFTSYSFTLAIALKHVIDLIDLSGVQSGILEPISAARIVPEDPTPASEEEEDSDTK